MKTAILHVDYEEPKPTTYTGISVNVLGGKRTISKLFKGTEPGKQIAEAIKWCKEKGYHVMCSSSVDHFEMDGGEFDFSTYNK